MENATLWAPQICLSVPPAIGQIKKTDSVSFSLIDVAVGRTPNVLKQVHYKIISLLLLLLFSVFDEKQLPDEGQSIQLVRTSFNRM